MEKGIRIETALALLKGVFFAIISTLVGMALLALIVVWFRVSDSALLALNQALKVISIFIGALMAVGLGGERGFVLGAVVGLCYMVLGYGIYCIFDGVLIPPVQMAGEFLMGSLIGALSGAVAANLRPRARRSGTPRRRKLFVK